MADGNTCFHLGCEHAKLHEHDCRSRDSNRGRRVHHDANWTVVGVAVCRVEVSYLGNGEQGEQYQAHEGHNRHGVEAGTTFSGPTCS